MEAKFVQKTVLTLRQGFTTNETIPPIKHYSFIVALLQNLKQQWYEWAKSHPGTSQLVCRGLTKKDLSPLGQDEFLMGTMKGSSGIGFP